MNLNQNKFKNLILYICDRAESQNLGATKLDKILWYSDIISYLMTGASITGETYVKREFGPFSPNLYRTINELEREKKLCVKSVDHYGHEKREYVPLVSADLDDFSAREISIVDGLIDEICRNFTAKGISEMSHDRIWKMANIGEEIPYEAVFAIRVGEIDETDIEWAQKVLADIESA